MRIVTGITSVFENEDRAIIIEDDCRPKNSFFDYCDKMLEKYKDDERIMMIGGNNPVALSKYEMKDDYCFSKNPFIWGWATWKRAWELYDMEICDWPQRKQAGFLKDVFFTKSRIVNLYDAFDAVYNKYIDTWDYQWVYCILKNNGLSIVPKYNLVDNLGWGIPEALHTLTKTPEYLKKAFLDKREFNEPIKYVETVSRNIKFDKVYENILLKYNKDTVIGRLIKKIKRIKRKLKKQRPYKISTARTNLMTNEK